MRRTDARATLHRRIAMVRAAFLLAFVGLSARAAHLTVFDQRGWLLGERQHKAVLTLAPERGAILDRNGRELALSVDAPSVYAVPSAVDEPARSARRLARALGRDPARIAARLRHDGPFVFLARWVTAQQSAAVKALGLAGVGIIEEPRRVYPTKELAAQFVGFANIDGRGVRGIEQLEDAWLQGTPRRLPVERDGTGHLLVDLGDEGWSTAGGDVRLTLDAAMQADAMLALRRAIQATRARGGVVVSLDPHTGDLLALAEAPGFDPNRFRELRYADTRSRAFLDALEPGSTLKAFLVAAALENGAVTREARIDCEDGTFRVPGKTIRDARPHGELSVTGILRVSSNIGAVKLALALGPGPHVQMLRRFGFGSSTGSGFPDESAGLLREPLRHRPVDHATLAFGQGLSVTPAQLAAATAALANEGRWLRPRLVAARRRAGGTWQPTRPEPARQVVSPQTAATLLAMLETVTGPDGTGRRAALRGVAVAGKTGTAQKFDPELGRYSDDRLVAWFIGAAPADAPRLVVVAALDEPRRPLHTGGAAAAPPFASPALGRRRPPRTRRRPPPSRPRPSGRRSLR
jgi:cell division protein FtsI (penicillin-binding protein 3)